MSSIEVHRQHYNVTFALLAAAAVFYALLQSLVAPALLAIQHDLDTTTTGAAWIHFAYLWLFWFPLVAVVIALVGIFFFVPESPVRARGRIDPVGAVLLGGWLVTLLVAISEGSAWGWTSGKTLGLLAATAVLIPVWIWWEARSYAPVVDMQMMRLRGVWTTNLAALLFGFGMYSSFILVPEFVEQSKSTGFGFSASVTQAGLFLLPAAIGMLLGGPISRRLSSTVRS